VDCDAGTEVILKERKIKGLVAFASSPFYVSFVGQPMLNSSTSNIKVEQAGIPAQAFVP
jgi:hypothetical protein